MKNLINVFQKDVLKYQNTKIQLLLRNFHSELKFLNTTYDLQGNFFIRRKPF